MINSKKIKETVEKKVRRELKKAGFDSELDFEHEFEDCMKDLMENEPELFRDAEKNGTIIIKKLVDDMT